jgi:hypothetical protein
MAPADSMIELAPTEFDDPAFLSLAQRIVNGAVTALAMREVFLVRMDNWFDWNCTERTKTFEQCGRELELVPR